MTSMLDVVKECQLNATVKALNPSLRRSNRLNQKKTWTDSDFNSCCPRARHEMGSIARCGTWKRRFPANGFGNWRTLGLFPKSKRHLRSVSIRLKKWPQLLLLLLSCQFSN